MTDAHRFTFHLVGAWGEGWWECSCGTNSRDWPATYRSRAETQHAEHVKNGINP